MKRSPMPARRTPMPRGSALRRLSVIRRRKLHHDPVWSAVRAVLWTRSGGRCEACGLHLDPATWQGHHRKLRARGGHHSATNALALCPACHTGAPYAVHRDVGAATFDGQIVPAHADPAVVPVRLYDGRWVLLTTDGGYTAADTEERT